MFDQGASKLKLFVCIQTLLYFHNHNGMIKTKIKKAIALAGIATIAAASSLGGALDNAFAANIGTGSVTGQPAFDSAVVWDDLFPGTATGTVSNIVVTAQVLPTLNMVLSTGAIDLGTLTAGVAATGTLDIEIGTNAAAGVSITARSGSGGLTNTTDNALQINSLVTDGTAESFTYGSTAGVIDSTVTGFATTGNLTTTEVNDNTTEHTIYTTNKPEQDNATDVDVVFSVATTSNAQTAAGNYEDTITFTVTGNF